MPSKSATRLHIAAVALVFLLIGGGAVAGVLLLLVGGADRDEPVVAARGSSTSTGPAWALRADPAAPRPEPAERTVPAPASADTRAIAEPESAKPVVAGGEESGGPAIVGRVISPNGEPVPGAEVAVLQRREVERAMTLRHLAFYMRDHRGRTSVRRDGRFRISFDTWHPHYGAVIILPPRDSAYAVTVAYLDESYVTQCVWHPEAVDEPLDLGNVIVPVGGVVSGRVVDATGAPAAGATVALAGEPWHVPLEYGSPVRGFAWQSLGPSAETNANGEYLLRGVPAGTWELIARREGHRHGYAEGVAVALAQETDGIDITLPAAVGVSVDVVDEHGRPVPRAHVRIDVGHRPHATEQLIDVAAEGRTDAAGRVAFERLFSRRFTVVGNADGRVEGRVTALADAGRWANVRVTLRQCILLSMRPVCSVTSEPIFAPDTQPRPRFTYASAGPRTFAPHVGLAAASVDADGTLRVSDLPLGSIEVSLTTPLHGTWGQAIDTVAGGVYDFGDVIMLRGPTLHVEVVDARGAPVAGATVAIAAVAANGVILPMGRSTNRGRTDALGHWVSGPVGGTHAVVTVTHASHPQTTAESPVASGPEPTQLRVVLELAAAVEGRVTNHLGEAVAGAEIALMKASTNDTGQFTWSLPRLQTTTDDAGRFEFPAVQRGKYHVIARAAGPDARGLLLRVVDLGPGQRAVADFVFEGARAE